MIAAAAAGIFGTAVAKSLAADAPKAASTDIHCMGVNECKSKGACKSANNECKGKNSCKGSGFLMMSAAECTKKGGTNMDAKK